MDAKPTQQFSIILSKEIWRDVLKFASKEQIEKLAKLETENGEARDRRSSRPKMKVAIICITADFSMWKKAYNFSFSFFPSHFSFSLSRFWIRFSGGYKGVVVFWVFRVQNLLHQPVILV